MFGKRETVVQPALVVVPYRFPLELVVIAFVAGFFYAASFRE